MPKSTITSTTQQFLDIFDITNNFVIMKDGTTSLIISVDAMNFGLLAEEEQDSVMYAYAGLLNSLNYTIQILIRSQTKDVTGYLHLLKDQEDASRDRGKQRRIAKYREFVSNLIRERNVLDKKFFVVIPAQPVELGILPPSSVLPGKGQVNITSVDRNLILEKARNILEPKKDHLIAQFARIGLYSRQLETQEIIQLFYLSYNPEASEGQQIGVSSSYTPPMVTAKVEGNLMNDSQIQSNAQKAPEEEIISNPTRSVAQAPAMNQDSNPAQPAQTAPPTPVQSTQVAPPAQSTQPDQLVQPVQPASPQEPNPAVIELPPQEKPATSPGAPLSKMPTALPTTDIPASSSSGGYSPTQMRSDQSNAAASRLKPAPAPATASPSASPSAPAAPLTPDSTPAPIATPPAPEIPKNRPGEEEKVIPRETGAPIQKPVGMPPLPEIQ